MLKSSLCDYVDAYILVKGIITIAPVPPAATNSSNNNKKKKYLKTVFHLLIV